jgi:O-antigen/teichoic acid export membrane protein
MSALLGVAGFLAWAGYLLIGERVLTAVLGESYLNAYGVSVWCLLAMVVWAFAQPLAPAMLAIGQYNATFRIHVMTTLGYIGLLYVMVNNFALIGAGIAFLAFYVSWAICMGVAFRGRISRIDATLVPNA